MTIEDEADVPYGENFHDVAVAAAWADAAARKRPWRSTIFDQFVSEVSTPPAARILELGSGPGFLAEQILARCPSVVRYSLLDFSEAMLALSRQRLAQYSERTDFLQADFKVDPWPTQIGGPFDLVVSLQAIHELRHKRHAPHLYRQIRSFLLPGAELLVCDHLPEGAHTPRHRVLYMSTSENLATLEEAGFLDARVVWTGHDMAMYRARA